MLPLISPFGLCEPLLSKPILDGPEFISIPGISGVAVPNATTPANAAAPVSYRWPQLWVLREMILMPSSGLVADAQKLSLLITDQQGNLIFDGSGASTATAATDQAPYVNLSSEMGIAPSGFHLTGWTWSPMWAKFSRLVRPGEQWKFQVLNAKAGGGSITPRLLFRVEFPLVQPPPPVRQRIFDRGE